MKQNSGISNYELKRLLEGVVIEFPKFQLSESRFRLWHQKLSRHSRWCVERAVEHHIESSRFSPFLSDILTKCRQIESTKIVQSCSPEELTEKSKQLERRGIVPAKIQLGERTSFKWMRKHRAIFRQGKWVPKLEYILDYLGEKEFMSQIEPILPPGKPNEGFWTRLMSRSSWIPDYKQKLDELVQHVDFLTNNGAENDTRRLG